MLNYSTLGVVLQIRASVSNRAITLESPLKHLGQRRNVETRVVVDANLIYAGVKPSSVLGQGAFPGDRYIRKEIVKLGALAEVAIYGDGDAFLRIR